MCGFVRPSEPLIDTLNTTCRSRYAKYNELGEDEDEEEENVSDSSVGEVEPVAAAGKLLVIFVLGRMETPRNCSNLLKMPQITVQIAFNCQYSFFTVTLLFEEYGGG